MNTTIAATLAALLTLFSASANSQSGRTLEAENCGVIYQDDSGKVEVAMLSSLHVLTLGSNDTFTLPADAPQNVKAVQCGRRLLAPQSNDYKVLAAGYLFNIVANERLGVLEIVEGQLRFRMIVGKMTIAEELQIQAFIDGSQKFFPKRPPNSSESSK